MERSGNFYKAIRLGYILISILIGCMAYNSLYEWQEIEALELGNKKIDELRKEINNINIQMIKFYLYLCHVLLRFTLVLICNTKISEKSDMAKSWATFCCSGTYK